VTTVRPQIGRPVTFQATDLTGVRYDWDFGDGSSKITRGPAASHTYEEPGNYMVTLTLHDRDGNIGTDYRRVQVNRGVLDGSKLPSIEGPSSSSRKDPAYSRVASRLARGPRAVFCWNKDDWTALIARDQDEHRDSVIFGFVSRSKPHQVNLAPTVCSRLDAVHYAARRPQPTTSVANAVHVLTHETIHTMGIHSEALTECFSMQLMGRMSIALGSSEAYGRRLTHLFWKGIYLSRREPASYRDRECHDGGKLDLFPESDVWP
jgi:hypothetical protein